MAEKKKVRVRFNRFAPPYVTGDIATFDAEMASSVVERGLADYVSSGDEPRRKKRGRPPKEKSPQGAQPPAGGADDAGGDEGGAAGQK